MVKSVFFSQFRRSLSPISNQSRGHTNGSLASASSQLESTLPSASKTMPPLSFSIEKLLHVPPTGSSSFTRNAEPPLPSFTPKNQTQSFIAQAEVPLPHVLPIKKRILFFESQLVNSAVSLSTPSSHNPINDRLPITDIVKKWIGFTPEERERIPFKDFAKLHYRSSSGLRKYVTQVGNLTHYGRHLLAKEQGKEFKPITADHIYKWCNLEQEQRQAFTISGFARHHEIDAGIWKRCITAKGVVLPRGQRIIKKNNDFPIKASRKIAKEDIDTWYKMSQEERNQISMRGFAKQRHINIRTLESYVTKKGKISLLGKQFLNQTNSTSFNPITADDIEAWCSMQPEERDQLKLYGFAKQRGLNLNRLRKYVTVQGEIQLRATRLLNGNVYRAVCAEDIKIWCDTTQEERDRITLLGFAASRNLQPCCWTKCVSLEGTLKILGECILAESVAKPRKITASDIHRWCGMSQEERNKISLRGFAAKYHLNRHSWRTYVTSQGKILSRGQFILDRTCRNINTGVNQESTHVSLDFNPTARVPLSITKPVCLSTLSESSNSSEGIDHNPPSTSCPPAEVQVMTHEIDKNAAILRNHLASQSVAGSKEDLSVCKTTRSARESPLSLPSNNEQKKY